MGQVAQAAGSRQERMEEEEEDCAGCDVSVLPPKQPVRRFLCYESFTVKCWITAVSVLLSNTTRRAAQTHFMKEKAEESLRRAGKSAWQSGERVQRPRPVQRSRSRGRKQREARQRQPERRVKMQAGKPSEGVANK